MIKFSSHSQQYRLLSKIYETTSSSLLLTGAEGVGKFTVALQYAKLLNCLSPIHEEYYAPCDSCTQCMKIAKKIHPDIKVVEPDPKTGNIKIDQIRELSEDAVAAPLEGKKRVFIIRDADKMLSGAASAFLKFLEEPLPKIQHILTSARPYALLPTIYSRCTSLRLPPVDSEEIANMLVTCYDRSREDALSLAAISQGAVGRAIELITDGERNSYRMEWISVLSQIHKLQPYTLSIKLDALFKGADANSILELAISWFRDLMILKYGLGEELLINRDCLNLLNEQAAVVSVNSLTRIFNGISGVQKQLSMQVVDSFALDKYFKFLSIIMSSAQ